MADNPIMPTEIVDEETRYVYSHTTDSAGVHAKTLLTAGTMADKNIRVKITTPAGSATTPNESIIANPSVQINSSTGLVTASVSGSKSVTPTVVPGYVQNGTAGSIDVSGSGSLQLDAKTAQTYTPGTVDQTIAAGQYLTGAQVIQGDADLIPENIADGVVIFGVTGTHKGGSETGIKAKLGSSDTIVILGGEYGPMGNAEEDYVVPIARNDLEVLINTERPFEIACDFKLTEYPSEKAAIFGALDTGVPMPAVYVEAGGASISYKIPVGTGENGPASYESGTLEPYEGEAFPLDTEIIVKFSFDGDSCALTVDDGSGYEVEEAMPDISPWTTWGSIAYGKNGATENSLAGVSGSYFNIDKCSITQWFSDSAVFGPEDDGKVVEDGALVEQTSRTVITKGTFDTTDNNSFTVNTPGPGEVLATLDTSTEIVKLSGKYGPTVSGEDKFINPIDHSGNRVTLDTSQPYDIRIRFKVSQLPSGAAFLLGAAVQQDLSGIHDLPQLYISTAGAFCYYLYSGDRDAPTQTSGVFENLPVTLNQWAEVRVVYDGTDLTLTVNNGSDESVLTFSGFTPVQVANAAPILAGGGGNAAHIAALAGSYVDIAGCYIRQGGTLIWGNYGTVFGGGCSQIETASIFRWIFQTSTTAWGILKKLNGDVIGQNIDSFVPTATMDGSLMTVVFYGTSQSVEVTAKANIMLNVYQSGRTMGTITPTVYTMANGSTQSFVSDNLYGGFYFEAEYV